MSRESMSRLHLVYTALCNGLYYFGDYGFRLDWNEEEYENARKELENGAPRSWDAFCSSICHEDIQMQMLVNGKGILFEDVEGEGEHTKTLTLELVNQNWHHITHKVLGEFESENDDANTSDLLLQYILFTDPIYG